MKNLKFIGLAFALGMVSLGSAAAAQVYPLTSQPLVAQQTPAVKVSARAGVAAAAPSGGLDEKIGEAGRNYPTTSLSSPRNMHSTTVVYE
ncbi:hypothetical protein [Martelella alba]|uniref:Multiple stress resistance protein BhsA n=1 Tax=Martelella alba TaxID=2590451 RepID=A0ABY2SK78_9HYPH|nr:hypothetical protein [Martelella alba]TKI05094.1 hypothetical protein FCN80_15425 [Martelella alba]